MRLDRLWLTDFRNYTSASLDLAPAGLTVIHGGNGQGKTNLLEAVAWLATLESFRGAPLEALVRAGSPSGSAVVRASGWRAGRALLIEGEITPRGPRRGDGRQGVGTRVLVNRQPLRRSRDLLGAVRVTVFSPEDLALIKGGPAQRRRYVDDLLVACHPRWDALRSDVDRILRQRATLLKQAGGRLSAGVALTLDVWDDKLATAGTLLADARAALIDRLGPEVAAGYGRLAGWSPGPAPRVGPAGRVTLSYGAPWRTAAGGPGLAGALADARADDLRRGLTTVGPHHDDMVITLDGLASRSHASQGEQRCLALALRLGGHDVVRAEAGDDPVLLLDDVFSELDGERSEALLACLPEGQALLTVAGPLPPGAMPAARIAVRTGVATTSIP